jgi:hypothetical protein
MQMSGKIRPVPWQLWPEGDQTTYRLSAYFLTVAFWALQITHAEEVGPSYSVSLDQVSRLMYR